jgi:hypothetical protein
VFLKSRFWHVSRDNNYCMLPSQKMVISIQTPDTHCLIYTCKIPANSLQDLLSHGNLCRQAAPVLSQTMLLYRQRFLKKRRTFPIFTSYLTLP